MTLHIYNLGATATSEAITALFSRYGAVNAAEVVIDVFTGLSRGFATVSMEDEEQGRLAIKGLNGTEWDGRAVTVEEVAEPTHRGSYKVGSGPVTFLYKKKRN
jgi:RNA recognition motif-containing protein